MFVPEARLSDGMRLCKIGGGAEVEFTCLSPGVLYVMQHWFRRAEICVGDGCPACVVQTARCVGFVAVRGPGGAELLLECSGSTFASCALDVGARIVVSRRGRRCPLRAVRVGTLPVSVPVSATRVMSAVCCLYRVPERPFVGESLEDFSARMYDGQHRRLAEAVSLASPDL